MPGIRGTLLKNPADRSILSHDAADNKGCLVTARRIHGLGVAGASGPLVVLFPAHFGTADQFAVKALRQIDDLPQIEAVRRMKPASLTPENGVLLIEVMRARQPRTIALSTPLVGLRAASTWSSGPSAISGKT